MTAQELADVELEKLRAYQKLMEEDTAQVIRDCEEGNTPCQSS